MAEPILQINGLAGVGLTYDPNDWKKGGKYYDPNNTFTWGTTGNSTGAGNSTGKMSGFNKVTKIIELLIQAGVSAAQIKGMWEGKQPIYIKDNSTGQQVDVKAEIAKQAQEYGKSNEQMLQMMVMMMQKNQQQNSPKNNTALYVGLGVGVVVLGGLVYLIATKKK